MDLTESFYSECIEFAKANSYDKQFAKDIVHDLILDKGNKFNSGTYKGMIIYAIKTLRAMVPSTQLNGSSSYKKVTTGLECLKCHNNFPESEFYVYISKSGITTRRNVCNTCVNAYIKLSREKCKENDPEKYEAILSKQRESQRKRVEKMKGTLEYELFKKNRNQKSVNWYEEHKINNTELYKKRLEYNKNRLKECRKREDYRKKGIEYVKLRRENKEISERESGRAINIYYKKYGTDKKYTESRLLSQKKYRDANKQKRAAYNKEYSKQWYKINRETAILNRKKTYAKNKEKYGIVDRTAKDRIKRYWDKEKKAISDKYVIKMLCEKKKHKRGEVTPEMILKKRESIINFRNKKLNHNK